jgi:hypothetical protein
MNKPEPGSIADADLDRLVRDHMDRAAEQVDPRPLFERIQASLNEPKPLLAAPGRTFGRRVILRWTALATAAGLILAVSTFFWSERTLLAHGREVIRAAREVHLQPIDRCYLVEVRRESSFASELPSMPQVRLTRLWTRGDRFYAESVRPEARWSWGRDEANRFWIAFGPHAAVRLDVDEIPPWLDVFCDVNSLNVETWLDEILARFSVEREPATKDSTSVIRIKAKSDRALSLGYPVIVAAEMEIDRETHVLRRVVIHRQLRGEPFATVTYSLVETDALDPQLYLLEGHLREPFQVFTRDHDPKRRDDLLARWFGPLWTRSRRMTPSSK